MKKYNFNGRQYIDLIELRLEVRKLRKDIPLNYANFDKNHQAMVQLAYNDIGKALYREELAEAKTPDEIRSVLELSDEWFVHCGKNYFIEWQNGCAVIGGMDLAMGFTDKAMAEYTAGRLGKRWTVIPAKEVRLLKAIFDTPSYTEKQADGVKEIVASALEKEELSEELKDRIFESVEKEIDGMVEESGRPQD